MRIEANRLTSSPVTTTEAHQPVVPQTQASSSNAGQNADVLPQKSAGQQQQAEFAELEMAVEKMNKAVKVFNHALEFEVTKSHRIVIRVKDANTGEIIRQIPPEELLDTFKRMEDALGVLIDRRV